MLPVVENWLPRALRWEKPRLEHGFSHRKDLSANRFASQRLSTLAFVHLMRYGDADAPVDEQQAVSWENALIPARCSRARPRSAPG